MFRWVCYPVHFSYFSIHLLDFVKFQRWTQQGPNQHREDDKYTWSTYFLHLKHKNRAGILDSVNCCHRAKHTFPGLTFCELWEGEAPISNDESKSAFPHNVARSATGVYNISSGLSPPNNTHPSCGQLRLLESSLYIASTCIFHPLLFVLSYGTL